MKIETELHEQTIAPRRSLSRAAKSAPSRVEPRSLGRRIRAGLRGGEQGSALVEFAMILPMMLLLTTGIMVFGIAMNNYLQLTNAVSMAARQLAVSAGVTSNPCAVGYTALTTAAPALTSSSIHVTYNFGSSSTSSTSCPAATPTTTGSYAAALSSGSTVQVTATYPLNLSIYGKVFSQSNAVLSATATELVQ